jgi:hypothetical protein
MILDTDRCYLCEEPFVKKCPMQKYCSHQCSSDFNRLKDIKEVFKLSPEDQVLRLKVLAKVGGKK